MAKDNLWKSWTNDSTYIDFDNCIGKVYNSDNLWDYIWTDNLSFTNTLTPNWNGNVAELEIDIPGVKKEHVSVTFEPGGLLIESKRKNVKSVRTVLVNTSILDDDQCEAKLEDGVLSLKLVQKEPTKKTLVIK
jgi:hypothetical protein